MEAAGASSQGAADLQRLREELQSLKHQNAELRGALQEACLSTLQPDAAQYVQVMSLAVKAAHVSMSAHHPQNPAAVSIKTASPELTQQLLFEPYLFCRTAWAVQGPVWLLPRAPQRLMSPLHSPCTSGPLLAGP